MRQMRTIRRRTRLSFRSSIRRALTVLYKRRAVIEDLILSLESARAFYKTADSLRMTPVKTSSPRGKRKRMPAISPAFERVHPNSLKPDPSRKGHEIPRCDLGRKDRRGVRKILTNVKKASFERVSPADFVL